MRQSHKGERHKIYITYTKNTGSALKKPIPYSFLVSGLGVLQPLLIFLQSDISGIAFLFHFSGLLTPGVEILVRDTSSLDPGKAFLIFLAVCLEYWIVRLFLCPLLEGSGLTAGLLFFSHWALTVLCADPSCLGEVASAVLAAPHCNASLHTTTQRVVDHVQNAGGVQNR